MVAPKDRAIIFPIFEECKHYTLDRCWIDTFSNFASNKFPPGVKYDPKHKILILRIGKSTETITLPDEPEELFKLLMIVIKQKLGMRSTRDLKIQQDAIEHLQQQRSNELEHDFKKIKPKHLKDQLIMNYIMKLKSDYNLTPLEYSKTASIVQLAFQFKSITADDVVYEHGVILDIKGIVFNKKTRVFSTPAFPKIQTKPEKISTADKFGSSMNKFVKDNLTRMQKYIP